MEKLSEKLAIVGRIAAQTVAAAATVTSDIVDMRHVRRLMAILNMGAYAAGNDGALTAKIELSNDGTSFTSAVDATGKNITASLFTGSAQDDGEAIIEIDTDDLVVSGTEHRYARLSVTVTNQNLLFGATLLGELAHYSPASEFDIAAVKEIVA